MRARAGFLTTALWISVVWFAGAGHRDLVQPDEGRYAEIPREMVASGDWITPRLNGLLYFEKPPLQYWATAAAYELFGEGHATARSWPMLLGLLAVPWVFLVGRRLFDAETGACAAVLLASSLLWVAMGHVLTLDTGLSAFLALALGALAWAQTHRGDPARERPWMLLAWAALGAAVLSKGPVAIVLTGGTVLLYGFWQRDLAIWKHLHLLPGLLVFLAVAAPWFVLAGLRHPGFTSFFWLRENFARYTSEVHRRVLPWWTFLPVVVLGSWPWIRPSLSALVRPGPRREGFDPARLLWVYCVFTVAFFSASRSKLLPYVLPVFPALALLAARRLRERPRLALEASIVAALGVGLLALVLFPRWIADEKVDPGVIQAYRPFVVAAASALLAGGGIVLSRKLTGLSGAAWLAGASLLGIQSLILGHQTLARTQSARELALAIEASVPSDAPVFEVRRYDQPLPFYLRRTVELVDYRGELAFGLDQAPERVIPDLDTFRRIWNEREQAAAVMSASEYDAFQASGLPMRLVYEDPRRVAVVRR